MGYQSIGIIDRWTCYDLSLDCTTK